MTYIPTNWQTGDVVTADKLNKIENAVANESGGGVLILELTAVEGGYNIGASFNDLKEAFLSGKKIITHLEFSDKGVTGEDWTPMHILDLMEGIEVDEELHFINFEVSINNHDYAYDSMIDDTTADIIVAASH